MRARRTRERAEGLLEFLDFVAFFFLRKNFAEFLMRASRMEEVGII